MSFLIFVQRCFFLQRYFNNYYIHDNPVIHFTYWFYSIFKLLLIMHYVFKMSSGSPRFLEAPDYANILDPQVTFSLRSHTTNISNCRVAKFTPRAGREKRVNCSISGSPPELLLTLLLHSQPWVEEGKWKLVIENELGTSETIITLSSSE